ncbi:chromosome segregation protein SMC, partial [Rhodovulum iodosum]
MRFTRIRLNGFKSFVDPTDLVIADGLTGVVGPNGCGKSNLLEALRWVMGENRPTAMRGGGMEDVIFAGAATRPARNFAEVVLQIDNTERLAPAGFNDADMLDIVRRITRDAGSAYKVNSKDVRARDVQMLFADASTGAQSPALVRQGQISELINAKPKARRRILEEAAGISGLYQRRHEAELKLRGAETNLARVDDVIEQLAGQLAQLARQARQAARYREIGAQLRQAEGLLLYRRWQEADAARAETEAALREATTATARAETAAREAARARAEREAALPPLREEEAIAGAVVQRLTVQRDSLEAREAQARAAIETLRARIAQLSLDIERESGLNRDAGDTIARLEREAAELDTADEGHEAAIDEAEAVAKEAASVLDAREAALSTLTEDVARLAARHQSALRLRDDAAKTLSHNEAEAARARAAAEEAEQALAEAAEAVDRKST